MAGRRLNNRCVTKSLDSVPCVIRQNIRFHLHSLSNVLPSIKSDRFKTWRITHIRIFAFPGWSKMQDAHSSLQNLIISLSLSFPLYLFLYLSLSLSICLSISFSLSIFLSLSLSCPFSWRLCSPFTFLFFLHFSPTISPDLPVS